MRSISSVGTKSTFKGMAGGARAVQLPDMGGVESNFLQVFGRPAGASACECERNGETSLAQTLLLLNSGDIYDKLGGGCAPEAGGHRIQSEAIGRRLPICITGRSAGRRQTRNWRPRWLICRAPGGRRASRPRSCRPIARPAYEDLLWALLNTKEFLFNH